MTHIRIDVDRFASFERSPGRRIRYGRRSCPRAHEYIPLQNGTRGHRTRSVIWREFASEPAPSASVGDPCTDNNNRNSVSRRAPRRRGGQCSCRPVTASVGRRRRFGEQVGDPNVQLLAELQQLVVGERQAIMLDLRQRRDGNLRCRSLISFSVQPRALRRLRSTEPSVG